MKEMIFRFLMLFVIAFAQATTITDDFSSYGEGSLGIPTWKIRSLNWRVRTGKYFCLSQPDGSSLSAELTTSKIATDTSISVTIDPIQRADTIDSWATAGVAIYADEENFWEANFVEAPSTHSIPYSHFYELEEMRNGSWSSSAEEKNVVWDIKTRWEWNTSYIVTISMTPTVGSGGRALISASWSKKSDGTLVARIVHNITTSKGITVGKAVISATAILTSFDDLSTTWTKESNWGAKTFPAFVAPSSCNNGPASGLTATGYFHTQKTNSGKWWFVDPLGKPFYVTGVDHISWWGHWCEALNRLLYNENVTRKYGNADNWAAAQIIRLKQWGFNTLAIGHSDVLRHRGLPHMISHGSGTFTEAISYIAPATTWTGFPNVFHPDWEDFLYVTFSDSDEYKNDPWVIGHFVDNELQWWGSPAWKCFDDWCMFTEVWKLPSDHSAKIRWVQFLQTEIPTNFQNVFHTNFNVSGITSASNLLSHQTPKNPITELGKNISLKFLRLVAETYFKTISTALKTADPNHLYLCNRFPGFAPSIQEIADKYCDVITYNYYPRVEPLFGVQEEVINEMKAWHSKSPSKPMMITEWSFPALDANLPSTEGAGMRVDNQAQRARCFSFLQSIFMGLDFMIGNDFFMMIDEPALGISSTFPENSNYGLVDVNDEPYSLLTSAASYLNPQACPRHAAGELKWISWNHQSWFEDDIGQIVTSYTTAARGITITLQNSAGTVSIFWNGKSLCKFIPSLGLILQGSSSDTWVYPSVVELVSTHLGSNTVSFDLLFGNQWNVNETIRITMPITPITTNAQPWISIRYLSIIDQTTYTPSFKLHYTALTIDSLIGDDLSTNDSLGTETTHVNFWQKGISFKDDNIKTGFGVWYFGLSPYSWANNNNGHDVYGIMMQDVSSIQKTLHTGEIWDAFGENISHCIIFPYQYSTVGSDWNVMDSVRNKIQSEIVIPTTCPPSYSSNDIPDGQSGGNNQGNSKQNENDGNTSISSKKSSVNIFYLLFFFITFLSFVL